MSCLGDTVVLYKKCLARWNHMKRAFWHSTKRVIESGILGEISIGFVRFFATSIGWFWQMFWGLFDFPLAFLSFSLMGPNTLI